MKFEKVILELQKCKSLDIIAASPENPTQGTTEITANTDPYEAEKW